MNPPTPHPAHWRTFWYWAAERMHMYRQRVAGDPPPWTADPVLQEWSFTNTYRVLDRTTQHLLAVQAAGPQATDQLFYRTLLFKVFNKPATWRLLSSHCALCSAGSGPAWHGPAHHADLAAHLDGAHAAGTKLYGSAYIMQPALGWGHRTKHRNHMAMLARMMADHTPARIADAPTPEYAYELLCTYHGIGPFLAYQYMTDLGYAGAYPYREALFVRCGPGALDGIGKVFTDTGTLCPADVVHWATDTQEHWFDVHGLPWRPLAGVRRLQPIDVQNLFCEVGKYLRAHGVAGAYGTRIKRRYTPNLPGLPAPLYPRHWDIPREAAP